MINFVQLRETYKNPTRKTQALAYFSKPLALLLFCTIQLVVHHSSLANNTGFQTSAFLSETTPLIEDEDFTTGNFAADESEFKGSNFCIDSAVEGASFLAQSFSSRPIDQQVFHLFSHGQPGKLFINGKWLNSKELAVFLRRETAPNTEEIYLYGCNFAKGDVGKAAVSYLEKALGVAISASTNITGQNGDWILENKSIDLTAVFAGYAYSLQDSDGDLINDDVDLDDDNDGILDTDEESCIAGVVNWGALTLSDEAAIPSSTILSTTNGNKATLTWSVIGTLGIANGNDYVSYETGATGGVTNNATLGINGASNVHTNRLRLTTTFDTPINDLAFTVLDVDRDAGNGFVDAVEIFFTVAGGTTYNVRDFPSYYTLGGNLVLEDDETYMHGFEGITDNAAGGDPSANIILDFGTLSIISVQIDYFSSDDATSNPVGQGIALSDFSFTSCFLDTDNDGTPDRLDLDSDNDSCPDFIEGGGTFVPANGTIAGGTLTDGNGGTVNTNLGNTVGTTVGVDNGIPTAAGTGQPTIGDSQNAGVRSPDCPCLNDADGDLVCDEDDLDDDNDGILDSDELRCDQPTYANSTSGSGTLQDQLYIFNWSAIGPTLGNGDAQTFTVNDLVVTGTFSNVIINGTSAEAAPSEMKTWSQALIGDLYNTPGSNEALYGNAAAQSFAFDVTFTATKNGVPYPLDIIAFDSESTSASEPEAITFITNGDGWTFIEGINGGGGSTQGDFSVSGNTLNVNDTQDGADNGNRLYFSSNASTISVDATSPGTARQAVGFGIYLRCDSDSDGILNTLDLDSDNDGCPDFVEGGGTFVPANGTTAGGTLTDGNGGTINTNLGNTIGTTAGVDNGVPTAASTGQTIGTSQLSGNATACDIDTDGDGVVDATDIDSDNDGIPDDVEMATATNGGDSDGDGIADYADLDSDNDGIPDLIEAGGTDTNGDGVVDDACNVPATCDVDGDGLMDSADQVDDSGSPTTGASGTLLPITDTDSDGQPDFQDLDADNDGINDITEAGITDLDNNGLIDQIDGNGALTSDADGDGFSDSLDPNDNTVAGTGDGAGTPAFTTDSDTDSDGIPNAGPDGTAYNAADTDSDGVPDFRDLDSDNDGINDIYEGGNATHDTNGDGSINAGDTGYADVDSDGIPDPIDNSSSSFGDAGNTAATDSDSDNVPDFQDLDSDNDGINDVIEGGNTDINGDGQVDNPTADADGDGIPDSVDGASGFGDETGAGNDPTNTDGVDTPDYQDLDSNNDGTTDFEDNGGDPALDTTPEDGTIDNITDADGDGIPDVVDGNTSGFGDVMTCGSGDVAYAMSDGTSNTTGFQWNGSADVASTDQFGLVRATLFCEDGTWRHYYNANEPDKFLFSIEMGANTTEIEYVEIRLQETPASLYDTMNTSAIFPMARDWFVKTVGNAALTANVNARFYFAPSELKAILDNAIALAETDGAATSPTVNDITWFKKDTYDPATDINPDGSTLAGGQGYTTLSSQLVPNTNGEIEFDNGVNFVQFSGLTGFSGGSAYVMVSGAALPVTLTSFAGKANACDVKLSWASASEQDFSHYEVEWSEDGRSFSKVGTKQGAANSLTARNYSYAHTNATKQNYYRLKQVDLDGSFEYSETIVVTTDCSSASMEVYPNPVSKTSNALTVNYDGAQEVVDFYIMDAMGRLVQQLTFDVTPEVNTRLEIDVTDLPTGTYFIGVTDPKVTVPATKFMVTN